ncbi:MAG: hypothetical protein NUW01_02395 [Gemmatimonadaceae bacterium]|nr:hypothetical protein [Gemmatimonadaceae bacterium]
MRPFFLLAAIPFALGCAQQSAMRVPALPTDEPLHVRLFSPAAGAVNYELSEPAYVAIFAIRRGDGISMIYPHFRSQMDFRSKAGFNQQLVHRLNTSRAYSMSAGYDSRVLLGQADAYYVIASKYPLPVEGILQSPWALRRLVGADLFRATNLSDTWYALEEMLVEGLPDDAWASDVYLNWRAPFPTFATDPRRFLEYCGDGRSYMALSLLDTGRCYTNRRRVTTTPVVPVVEVKRRNPPKKPFDRDPSVPLPPDQIVARTSRSGSEVVGRARSRSEDVSRRGETGRESDRRRGESVRPTDREVSPIRQQPAAPPPAPARATESRPQQQPSRPEVERPVPKPDN